MRRRTRRGAVVRVNVRPIFSKISVNVDGTASGTVAVAASQNNLSGKSDDEGNQ
jgi:hypothetical protein